MGPIGVSAMVDLYVQKVCLEATQLIASLKMEVMVMHTVNGYPDEGWDNAVTSAQKIVEFIDLFCKKSQQKISMLALVIIDKLQGAHNKFLEAARTKHSEIAKTIALTSAKLLQKAAKFYTYALIAERSGQTVFRALHIQAGRYLAFEATQQHCVFEYADMEDHFKSVRTKISNSVKQVSSGNNRSSRMYDIVAHYYKALAAIAIDNFDNNAQHFSSLLFQSAGFSLLFQSAGLQRVYLHFEHQLYTIAECLKRGMLWQADVLVIDLQNHTNLLDPCICIDNDVQNVFTTINALVESTVHITPDQDALLNQNSSTVTALQITHILHMGKTRLYQYVLLLQEQVYCEELIVKSHTNMYANGPRITSFYRRLWKHIHQLAMSRAPAVREAIYEYFDGSGSQSETECQGLHIRDWICVTVTLEDVHTCLKFYSQQLRHVRPDRPAKVVEVITRAWHSAQSILQQSLIYLEAQVLQKDVFVSVVPREDVQGAHNTACFCALAYAQIAQELYQNTAGFYTEFKITKRIGEKLCTEALTSVMVQLAVFAEEHLTYLDEIPDTETTETEPNHEDVITKALDALEQMVLSRENEALHALDQPRTELWRSIYRIQVQHTAYTMKNVVDISWSFEYSLTLLVNKATKYDRTRNDKTIQYLLLCAENYLQFVNTTSSDRYQYEDVSDAYGLAAIAQDNLSEASCKEFDPNEDVSVTLARLRVDRHLCVAQTLFDSIKFSNGTFWEAGPLLNSMRELLSHKGTSFKTKDNSKQLEAIVWENAVAKEVFSRHLHQSAFSHELLPDYGVTLNMQQKGQICEFIDCRQKMDTSFSKMYRAKRRNDEPCTSWWMRAQSAIEMVRISIYAYCFEAGTLADITQHNLRYESIMRCAISHEEGRILHPLCSEFAQLALQPPGTTFDDAARAQHNTLCNYYAQFLIDAANDDSAQIELSLAAIGRQKRVVDDLISQQIIKEFNENYKTNV